MKQPCPSCPDGNEWNSNGPTGRACPTCKGKAYLGSDDDEFYPDDDDDDSEYCECDEQPIEEEEISGRCFACGKILL